MSVNETYDEDRNPRDLRIFDNGGETADRYTVFIEIPPWHLTAQQRADEVMISLCITMSENPYSPQGVGMVSTEDYWISDDGVQEAKNFGPEIEFTDLPPRAQDLVLDEYVYLYGTADETLDSVRAAAADFDTFGLGGDMPLPDTD